MVAFNKLSDGSFKKFGSFCLAVVICGILSLPAKAEAGWLDTQITNLETNIEALKTSVSNVKGNVQNVVNAITNAAGKITDGKIANLISDMQVMLKTAVDAQQAGVDAFMPGGSCVLGTPCGNFRADLINIVHVARALNNKILTLHNIPGLNLEIQDLGLADLIEKLPGRALLPIYKVLTKAQLLTPQLIDALQNAGDDLANLKTVLFIEGAPSLPTPLERCQFVDTHSTVFKISAGTIKGIGMILKLLGKLFEALGKTPAGGPNEVDAGIHGYVHATVKTNTLGTIGKILGGIAGPISSVSSYVSNKVSACGDMVRDFEIKERQLLIIDNQATLIDNQQSILLGQKETLCAIKNNLPDQCSEFVGNGFGNKGKNGF